MSVDVATKQPAARSKKALAIHVSGLLYERRAFRNAQVTSEYHSLRKATWCKSKGPKRRPSLARRLTKMHSSDGATGNLMTAPGQTRPCGHAASNVRFARKETP